MNSACGARVTNKKRRMNEYLYDIRSIVPLPLSNVAIPKNMISSFRATEISPLDKNIFNDFDFYCHPEEVLSYSRRSEIFSKGKSKKM